MSSPRHDPDLMVIAQPDWWSRLLALGALLVAGAALYWTYLRDRDVRPQEQDYLAEIRTAVNNGINSIQTQGDQQQRRLSDYVNESLLSRRETVADRQSAAPDESQPAFEEPLAQPSTATTPPSSLANEPPAESADRSAEREPSVDPQPVPGPDLRLVYTALRPAELIRVPTVTVRNQGDLPAVIIGIRFLPEYDLDGVPVEVGSHDFGSSTDQQLVVRFTSADNQAEDPQAHGTYEQTLATEYRIEPGGEADVFVMIRNMRHVKYGLRGRLTLLCQGDQFSFEDAMIPFVE